MDQMNPERHVLVSVHSSELYQQLSQFLKTAFADHLTVEADKAFVIGYSGGSMSKALIPVLEGAIEQQHRSKIRFFPVDERLVPINHADNNTGVYLKQLTQIFDENQFAVLPEETLGDGQKAAEFLHKKLAEWSGPTKDGWPRINVLFLGMGPDGHICSLFPQHPLLKEATKWTVPIEDSPKPPPRRVTITIPVVNAAQHVAFIVLGEEKAEILEKIIVQKSTDFPVGLIKLKNGNSVNFFLDNKAASKIVESNASSSVKISGHL